MATNAKAQAKQIIITHLPAHEVKEQDGATAIQELEEMAGYKAPFKWALETWRGMDSVLQLKTILAWRFTRALDRETARSMARRINRAIAAHNLNVALRVAGRG